MQPLIPDFQFKHLDPLRDRWDAIEQYNVQIATLLPAGARELALADWHYNYNDPRSPHDSWLRSIEIQADPLNQRIQSVALSLLGAFHDRVIRFEYLGIIDLSIEGRMVFSEGENADWLYDELHLLGLGSIEHLIEFTGALVRIESADLKYSFSLRQTEELPPAIGTS